MIASGLLALQIGIGDLAVVVAAVFVAATIQSISGFGFGLLAVPLMTIAIASHDAVVVATLTAVVTTTFQAWHGRADVIWPLVRRLAAAAYVGMPLGLWIFIAVDEEALKIALGGAVLVAVVLLAFRIDMQHSGPALDFGAGFLSGVLNTSLSTNGPPLVFVLQARHLEPQPFRSTISMVFALCNLAGVTLFVAAGKITGEGVATAGIAIPALVVGQLIGFPLRKHLHGERFRWMVLGLLAAAATSAILGAVL